MNVRNRFFVAISTIALTATAPANAAVNYLVNSPIGANGSVVGNIVTDGTFGVLSASNFSAWNLTVTGNGGIFDVLNNLNSGVFTGGTKITADASHIYFDFTHDNANPSYLLFQRLFSSGNNYVCASNATFSLTPCFEGSSAVPQAYNSPSASFGNPDGIQIIATAAAVPEPASWLMMIAGFGALGIALRCRRAISVSFA